jgi:hypothetical protein
MNPALAHLTHLATLDAKLKRFRARRQKQEDEITSARSALDEAKTHLGGRDEEVLRLQKEADALNLEVRTAEGEVERLSAQLMTAKSNKEYDVLNREVEAAKEQQGKFEDDVLERLERADAVAEEKAAATAAVEAAKAAVEAAAAAAAELDNELAGDEKALTDDREVTLAKLDVEIRRLYEALLAQRGDSAIARVKGGTCSACARKLTAQMGVLMDNGQEIVQCMSCNRILYHLEPEEPGL